MAFAVVSPMSIAQVSFNLNQFDAALSDGAQPRNLCEQRVPPATTSQSPPARPLGISREKLGLLIVQNMYGLERFAFRLRPQRADAQDLVQETCRKALVAHGMFRPGTNVAAWLGCIMRNLHRDWARRGWHEISVAGPLETWATPAPEEPPFWSRVSDEDVAQALADLPSMYRSVYVLRANEGCSYPEIARILGIPAATVATRLFRARGMLRELLLSEPAVAHSQVSVDRRRKSARPRRVLE
jgi:RNA polymerase sigma-70 factor, ECF subfamily